MNKITIKEAVSRKWKDAKMVDWCLKNTVYIDMGEYYLDLMSKPKIDSTIHYADQIPGTYEMAEDPGTSWEVFKNYNTRLNSPARDLEYIENGYEVLIMNQYRADKPDPMNGLLKAWSTKRWNEDLQDGQRLATAEELEIITKALKTEAENYEKRLRTYYKRYKNKINTNSYWADR